MCILGGGVFTEFLIGGLVDFYKGEVTVASYGETDGADAGVEVEDFGGRDVGCDRFEG